MIQKAFNIGNSTAITIPASANIKAGTKFRVKKITKNEITYEVVEDVKSDVVRDYISSVTNGFPIDKMLSQKELVAKLKYLEDNQYEEKNSIS